MWCHCISHVQQHVRCIHSDSIAMSRSWVQGRRHPEELAGAGVGGGQQVGGEVGGLGALRAAQAVGAEADGGLHLLQLRPRRRLPLQAADLGQLAPQLPAWRRRLCWGLQLSSCVMSRCVTQVGQQARIKAMMNTSSLFGSEGSQCQFMPSLMHVDSML